MAVLALSADLRDMRDRLGRMVIGNNKAGMCVCISKERVHKERAHSPEAE